MLTNLQALCLDGHVYGTPAPYRDHKTVHREATFIALSKNNLPFRGRGYYLTAHVRKKEKQSFSDNYTLRFIT